MKLVIGFLLWLVDMLLFSSSLEDLFLEKLANYSMKLKQF